MKFTSILVAASLAFAPVMAVAQSSDDENQVVGVPPEDLPEMPAGVLATGGLVLLLGAGAVIGLASGGGDGPTGTTSTN